jgi:hypothetical protein
MHNEGGMGTRKVSDRIDRIFQDEEEKIIAFFGKSRPNPVNPV